MGKTNIIELNGTRYDAGSGGVIDDDGTYQVPVKVDASAATPPQRPTGQHIDGIMRGSASHPVHHHVTADSPAPAVPTVHHESAEPSRPRHEVHHVTAHPQERAKTLMRSSVSKPSSPLKATLHVQTPIQSSGVEPEHHLPQRHTDIIASRLERAQQASKSDVISRYGGPAAHSYNTELRPVAVKEPPSVPTVDPEPHLSAFDAVLASASSHLETPPAKKHKRHGNRIFNIAAATLAFILIAGFILYQNAPNLDLHLISSRADFTASMPSYKPAGFGFTTPIVYSAGEVTLAFHSNTDKRTYDVIEQQSNWDDQTLVANFVVGTSQSYQTVDSHGRTLYLFDGNATWVDGNVWYQITGDNDLTNTQLINIANSL